MSEVSPLVRAQNIFMAFEGVDVVKDVSLDLFPSEIHALVGENGAGKSTLAKIIAGVYQPKAGTLSVNGNPVVISGPQAASALGIALIHQEPLAFPDLTVAENIFVGRQPTRARAGWVDWRRMETRARELLGSLGLKIDPRAKMRGLSIADQQLVDIAAALSQNARIVLMDEPTAALTPGEVAKLFAIMRQLREQGAAIVFVSHRLEEVFDISDRISVLRDGELVGSGTPKTTPIEDIIRLMVGRPLSAFYEKKTSHTIGAPVLQVKNLTRTAKFQDVSFTVCAGEIVGFAGLVGSGRTDVGHAIFGIDHLDHGTILIDGVPQAINSPRDALARGLVYVPEDRQHQGLLMPMNIAENMTLPILRQFSRRGWMRGESERRAAAEYVNELRIVLRSVEQPVRELSGGNQQKVVLSKWLMTKPRVIILDEPTRGIDIGAKTEVYRLMSELSAQGIAILMISSELPEILAMSDRVLVMREGRIAAELGKAHMNAERIMAAATGQVLEGEPA